MAAAGKKKAVQQEAKRKRKIIIFAIEIIIILVMLVVLWLVMRTPNEGPKRVVIDPANLGIPSQIVQEKESGESPMLGYMNVALFGVDAKTDKELYKGSNSDSIMIASINLDTGDIKLVSVYRDTLLSLNDGTYRKCNAAYALGGAEHSVWMLNTNLDMDIETFVTVNYKGLIEVIDGLGGLWIDVNETELSHINNYQIGISEILKCDYTPVTTTGYQRLNGMQATAFCRIRYGGGDDYRRAARQREVLRAIEKEAKEIAKTNPAKLVEIFEACIGDIYTNITDEQILDMIANIMKYRIVDEVDEDANGFPQRDLRTSVNIDKLEVNQQKPVTLGSTIVPYDLEANVVWLHHFLFEDEEYVVTDMVKEISDTIKTQTAKFINSR